MGGELVKHPLRRELQSRGVCIERWIVVASDDRIIVSGEAGTYYEIQLIATFASTACEGRDIVNNLSIVPSTRDFMNHDPRPSIHVGESHRLRNRLSELTLATRLLQKGFALDNLAQAKTVVAVISQERFAIVRTASRRESSPSMARTRATLG